MRDFNAMFAESQGAPLIYNGNTLVMNHCLPFTDGDQILVTFESTNSEWRQGIGLDVFGYFIIDGEVYKDCISLWEDTSPHQQVITLKSDSFKRRPSKRSPDNGMIRVKNIWSYETDCGICVHSYIGGAAMIVEDLKNGKRYRCNDGHLDDNFDDIIFTIQTVK